MNQRQFDDYFNVWAWPSCLFKDYTLEKAIGSQSIHDFISWIDFRQRMKNITVCFNAHTRNFRNEPMPLSIVGLKIDTQDSDSKLLGRCSVLKPSFNVDDNDCLIGFTIEIIKTPRSWIIKKILFKTKQKRYVNFKNDEIITSNNANLQSQIFQNMDSLCLIGFAWFFDLSPDFAGDQGIQSFYQIMGNPKGTNASFNNLYPSIAWNRYFPQHVRLRPIPEMKANSHAFISSLFQFDDISAFTDCNIIAIHIYYNAFLQKIVFEYKNKQIRALKNKVEMREIYWLKNEWITAVWFYERVQTIFEMSLPREKICFDGIHVSQIRLCEAFWRKRF